MKLKTGTLCEVVWRDAMLNASWLDGEDLVKAIGETRELVTTLALFVVSDQHFYHFTTSIHQGNCFGLISIPKGMVVRIKAVKR